MISFPFFNTLSLNRTLSNSLSIATIVFLSGVVRTDASGNRFLQNTKGDDVIVTSGKAVKLTSSQQMVLNFNSSQELIYLKDGVLNTETGTFTTKTISDATYKDFYGFDKLLNASETAYMKANPEKFFSEVNLLKDKAPFTVPTSYVDVTNYGAIGDGVTDSAQAFHDAKQVSPNLYVPAGTFVINDNTYRVIDTDLSMIFGEGTITSTTRSEALTRTTFKQGINVMFNGITFIGQVTFTYMGIDEITIQNCTFLHNQNFTDSNGIGVSSSNNPNNGTEYKVGNVLIRNNIFKNIDRYPIENANMNDPDGTGAGKRNSFMSCIIENNIFQKDTGTRKMGISWHDFGQCEKLIIRNNYMSGFGGALEVCARTEIYENTIINSDNLFAGGYNWSDVVIRNNYIEVDNNAGFGGTKDTITQNTTYIDNVVKGVINVSNTNISLVSNNIIYSPNDAQYPIFVKFSSEFTFSNNYQEQLGSVSSYAIRLLDRVGDNYYIENNNFYIPQGTTSDLILHGSDGNFTETNNNTLTVPEVNEVSNASYLHDNLTCSVPMFQDGNSMYDYKQDMYFDITGYTTSCNVSDSVDGIQQIFLDKYLSFSNLINFNGNNKPMYIAPLNSYPTTIEETTSTGDIYKYVANSSNSFTLTKNGVTITGTQLNAIELGAISRMDGNSDVVVNTLNVYGEQGVLPNGLLVDSDGFYIQDVDGFYIQTMEV